MTDQRASVEGSTTLLEPMGLLRGLLDVSQLMVIVIDRQGTIHFLNNECERVSGYEASEVIGRRAAELCLLPTHDILLAGGAPSIAGAHGAADRSHLLRTRTGEPRRVNWRTVALPGDAGQLLGMGVDITGQVGSAEQQALQRRLTSEQERSQAVLANAIDGILIVNARGAVRYANPAAERLFDRSASQLLGQNVKLLLSMSEGKNTGGKLKPIDLADPELRHRDIACGGPDGTTVDIDLALAEFDEHGERLFVCFLRDLRDCKRAERAAHEHLRALAHMERLAAMNEITAGLAHEINQPLTAIAATAEACLALMAAQETNSASTLPDQALPPQLYSALEQISLQARRAADIVGDVRAFVRREDSDDSQLCALDALIHAVLQLLRHDLDAAGIVVRERLCTPAAACAVNRVQIEQVIFNLVRNAIDAMIDIDGPRILTVTSRVNAAAQTCMVRVSDTGTGIASQHMDQVFNPFFTTKQHGLGQGLSICRSIIDAHQGRLTATNRAKGGAAFSFVLPHADQVGA